MKRNNYFFPFSKWKCPGKSNNILLPELSWPFTVRIFCSIVIWIFTRVLRGQKVNQERPRICNLFEIHFLAPQNPRKIQITLEKILTAGQNNYGNKIPFLATKIVRLKKYEHLFYEHFLHLGKCCFYICTRILLGIV